MNLVPIVVKKDDIAPAPATNVVTSNTTGDKEEPSNKLDTLTPTPTPPTTYDYTNFNFKNFAAWAKASSS